MSLHEELSEPSTESLTATYDAIASAPDDDSEAAADILVTKYGELLNLVDHASEVYARHNGLPYTADPADMAPRLLAFKTGAMAIVMTLAQQAEQQQLRKQLGL